MMPLRSRRLLALALICASSARLPLNAQTTNQPFVVNDRNILALAAYACSGVANIQTDTNFRERLLVHSFRLSSEGSGIRRVTGVCHRELKTSSTASEGKPLSFVFDENAFQREDSPVMTGRVGEWDFKFYFQTRATYADGAPRFQKELDRMTIYNGVEQKLGSLLPKALLDQLSDGLEKINASSLSFNARWEDPSKSQALSVEGTGYRWIIALTAWRQHDALYMNAAPLTRYWGTGEGRPGGEKGNAVYWGEGAVLGCSYFSDAAVEKLTVEGCMRIWSSLGGR